MIIGVDGNEANVKEKVGVSVYTFELLNYFAKKAKDDCRFVIYLKNPPQSELPKPNFYFSYRIVRGNFLWSQIFLPANLYLKKEIDLFFSPAHYSPRFCPVPTVVTIHDLSYFYYPNEFLKKDLYQLKNWTKYSVKKAIKVITVSKTTKKDLINFYQIPEEKIEVIYNGYEKQIKNQKLKIKNIEKLLKLKIKKPFILFVGTIQPRKNLKTLIEAFYHLLKEKPNYSLVIVGKKGWLFEKIFTGIEEKYVSPIQDKIIFTGYLENDSLVSLYQNASVFVLPSFYEGFGIPLLEAMSFGCPVISSSASSLPEIGSDTCLYFDPNSVDDLKDKLIELLENNDLRKELIKKGKERVKLFSWEKCGRETLELFKKPVRFDKFYTHLTPVCNLLKLQ